MMLVEHDVKADLVTDLIFVVVAMKQIGGDPWIALAIGKNDAQRPGMIVPGGVIRLFAELIDSHHRSLLFGHSKRVGDHPHFLCSMKAGSANA